MTTRYRLLDAVDWDAIKGKRFEIDVSDSYIVLMPLKAGMGFTIIAQAIKPRGKLNGQPADDGLPDAETLLARETFDA